LIYSAVGKNILCWGEFDGCLKNYYLCDQQSGSKKTAQKNSLTLLMLTNFSFTDGF